MVPASAASSPARASARTTSCPRSTPGPSRAARAPWVMRRPAHPRLARPGRKRCRGAGHDPACAPRPTGEVAASHQPGVQRVHQRAAALRVCMDPRAGLMVRRLSRAGVPPQPARAACRTRSAPPVRSRPRTFECRCAPQTTALGCGVSLWRCARTAAARAATSGVSAEVRATSVQVKVYLLVGSAVAGAYRRCMAETHVAASQWAKPFVRSMYIGCDSCGAARESPARVAARTSRFRPPVAHQAGHGPAARELPA